MPSLVEDLSILTTIPEKTLHKLSDKALYCISDSIEESILKNESVTEIDLDIGKLLIKHTDNEVKYKFIPSAELNKVVINTINNKLNLLEDTLEKSLVEKVTKVYKDLI